MKAFVPAALLSLAFAASAALADAHSEVVQAETHAGFAAAASDIEDVHHHLHHALNCLVGPDGIGFDAQELNPCAHAGNGAIPDTTDAAKKKALKDAVEVIFGGIAESDYAKAKAIAAKVAAMLKKD